MLRDTSAKFFNGYFNLKDFLAAQIKTQGEGTTKSIWDEALAAPCMFPHFIKLFYIYLVLAVQTACVERGFNLHRIIKHRLTNRLSILSVDSLMRVKALGSSFNTAPRESFEVVMEKIKELVVEALPILEARPLRDSDRPPLIISKLASSANESFSFPVIGKVLPFLLISHDGDGDFGQGEEEVVVEEMGGTGLLYDEVQQLMLTWMSNLSILL